MKIIPVKKVILGLEDVIILVKWLYLKHLAREGKQAGAIVLREAYNGYVPLGVFNVRENVRNAMNQNPLEFDDMKTAIIIYFNQTQTSNEKIC